MKIIDLLNMIVNEEKLPKKVKYDGNVYEYAKGKIPFFTYLRNTGSGESDRIMYAHMNKSDFNSEVEIVEEDEEIDIQNIKELEYIDTYGVDTTDIKLNRDMIIQLTRAVKQLDNKIKEIKC